MDKVTARRTNLAWVGDVVVEMINDGGVLLVKLHAAVVAEVTYGIADV